MKYIEVKKIKGRRYVYFRRGRSRIRLPDTDDPRFALEYQKLLTDNPRPEPGYATMAWLIASYRKTPRFIRQTEKTKRDREYYFERIRSQFGDALAAKLTRPKVFDIRNSLVDTPGTANNYISTLAVLMKHAVDIGLRVDNPCAGVEKLQIGEYLRWPEYIWQAALEAASPMLRLALITLYYSGQRVSDVVTMSHTLIHDGLVEVRQQKTGKLLAIPLDPAWQAEIDTIPRKASTLLYSRYGQPLTPGSLQERWRRLRPAIGADSYHLHGLRKNACCGLAEAGCTEHEISAITGQSLKMVQHYTKMANQKVLAIRAITKRAEHDRNKSAKLSGKSAKLSEKNKPCPPASD